jgi:hypothetical protein
VLYNSFCSATEHSRKQDISVGDEFHASASATTEIRRRSLLP